MSREATAKGWRGEYRAAFLSHFFLEIAYPQAGSEFDLTCRALRLKLDSEGVYRNPTLRFHFQIKTGTSFWKGAFQLHRPTFDRWLHFFENEPVIALYVRELTATTRGGIRLPSDATQVERSARLHAC